MSLTVLGLLQFDRRGGLSDSVRQLGCIPTSREGDLLLVATGITSHYCAEWMGQLLACRLFFDFMLWREAKQKIPNSGFMELGSQPPPRPLGSDVMYNAAKAKVTELLELSQYSQLTLDDLSSILSAYNSRLKEWHSLKDDIELDLVMIYIYHQFALHV